ncbi:autotransporter domain-containing protein [Rhizobium sp. S-51]|uniref:Autotransporter domain-containing protein n=1 Tax=Rhizobium terricola TaxID=2728849 RepID=A0A7Y0FVV5_9HYPH|nr:autotransporter domain-containing protein [Rhizobium terricola]NML74817.1 autotransporter domain-containing protein [Rhizobium terricola]
MLVTLLGSTALMMPSPAKAEFRDLSAFAPGAYWFTALGVSGDGNYMVGEGVDADGVGRSFFYDVRSGTGQDIGLFASGEPTIMMDVSNSGIAVGVADTAAFTSRAVTWTRDAGFQDLGTLDGMGGGEAGAIAISDDGNRIVGWSTMQGGNPFSNAFVWIRGATSGVAGNAQMYALQALQGGDGYASADAISANGQFVAGSSTVGPGAYRAVRWNAKNILTTGTAAAENLGTLGGEYSFANAINTDGRVVVGFSRTSSPYGTHAFRWEEGGTAGVAGNVQMEDLGTLGGESSDALAVSGNGKIVVGSADDVNDEKQAFRWTRETGMLSLADWLAQSGVDVGDIALIEATGISNDGGVIVGRMNDPENSDGDTPFIARVAVPGEGGSGLMNVNEFNATVYDAGYIGWAAGNAFKVPLNGAHHRVLMDFPTQPSGICGWTNGDLAHYDDGRDTGVALAEAGLCGDLADGTVRVGLGGGLMHSTQDLMNDGSAELDGRYLVGELDWRPDGLPVIFSLTGLYGGSDAEIRRAYSNGATMAYSEGETDLVSGTLRLRADWKDAFRFGTTSFSPYVSYAVSRTTVDGYTETGGSFPATFDEQVVHSGEVRLGLASRTELTSAVALRGSLELVHGAGDAPHASGQVIGLHGFSFGGGSYSETWVRAGADLDVKVTDSALLSLSMHAATEGLDAQISGAARLQVLF